MHLLYKHKDKCNSYVGILSDEHVERFHKETQIIEKRFKQCLNKEMFAEYIPVFQIVIMFKTCR